MAKYRVFFDFSASQAELADIERAYPKRDFVTHSLMAAVGLANIVRMARGYDMMRGPRVLQVGQGFPMSGPSQSPEIRIRREA